MKAPEPTHALVRHARPPFVSFTVKSATPGRVGASDIVATLAEDIRGGRLPPGSRLPPVRTLEQQFGLSKNTAQSAYDELVARGLLEAREREGVFVAAATLPGALPPRVATPPLPELRPAPDIGGRVSAPGVVSLSSVFLDPELLPRDRLAECARSVLRQPGLGAYHDPHGYGPLRELIAERLRGRGMLDVTAANVLVTAGSQQALDVVARQLARKRVATESPVYWGARLLFASHGHEITALPIDPFGGLPLDAWEARLRASRPGLLYAITSYQNPTGYSYTSHELARVLELSEELGFAIAEDDWGSDMLSGSEYRPSLRLLGGPHVVYMNSFTKKLLPSLRVGFLVGDARIVPALVAAKRLATLGNPWITEAVLAEFLDRGYYDTHLAALQGELDVRYTRCIQVLRETMPEDVRFTMPGGGPTLWLELPRSIELEPLRKKCLARGVAIESTANAFDGEPHLHGFRVGYALLPPDTLARAIGVVGEVLREARS